MPLGDRLTMEKREVCVITFRGRLYSHGKERYMHHYFVRQTSHGEERYIHHGFVRQADHGKKRGTPFLCETN